MTLYIPGIPQPLRRHRQGRGRSYDDPRNAPNREAIRYAWLAQAESDMTQAKTIGLRATFAFPRPKSHYLRGQLRDAAPQWHRSRPDVDNLLKLVLDALNGIAYGDDAQVVAITGQKRYCAVNETPHSLIWIGEWYGDMD